MTLTLGLLAGEASGDNLGAGLMGQIRAQVGQQPVRFIGVGGPRMQEQGLEVLAPMDMLAVNGFRDPILRLPQLIRLLRQLIRDFSVAGVDGFVGVDFNVFNFLLEAALKRRGIKTAHYVSPSVYAWRAGRVKRVAKSADLLLCLYPFEPAFYKATTVHAEYVGHPLAVKFDPTDGDQSGRVAARDALGIAHTDTVLALLPGSRDSEVRLMLAHFLAAADLFCARHDNVCVVIPCLRATIRAQIEHAMLDYPNLRYCLDDGNARRALLAADVALVKAGTSTLEAMLLHRPMVVSYRLGGLTYQLAKRVLRTPFVALPNILAGQALVPELLQHAGTGEALAEALSTELSNARDNPGEPFLQLHEQLRQGADAKAAVAVLRLLQ